MELRFDESQIRYYAKKYKEEEEGYDNPIETIVDDVKARGYLTKSELIAVSGWARNKRNKTLIKNNCDDLVQDRTGIALSSDTAEGDRIACLRELNGVRTVVASAILHWFHEDRYPIWSPPARYSVCLDETLDTTSREPRSGEWEEYVSFCRSLAQRNNVNICRTLDRALWKYCDDQRV